MDKLNEELQVMLNLIYKSKHGVCLSDKQGRAGAVMLAFPGRYLLVAQGKAGQRPLDLLAIYKILGENQGTCI
jgi:hypothetical protein